MFACDSNKRVTDWTVENRLVWVLAKIATSKRGLTYKKRFKKDKETCNRYCVGG